MSDSAAQTCGQPMRGIYGAETTCGRPAGHTGKHDPIWNHEDWPDESPAAQPRRIGVDACWCSEDDNEPKYGHADDHILGRTPSAAPKREYRLRREFLGASGIYGTDYVPLYGNPSEESAFAAAREHLKHAKRVIVESREATPWTREGSVGDA